MRSVLQDRHADVGGEGDTLTVDRSSGNSARYRGVVIALGYNPDHLYSWYEKTRQYLPRTDFGRR